MPPAQLQRDGRAVRQTHRLLRQGDGRRGLEGRAEYNGHSGGKPAEDAARVVRACAYRAVFHAQYGSLFSLPRRLAPAKPLPNSTPLHGGDGEQRLRQPVSSPPNIGAPTPAGRPVTAHSTTPPRSPRRSAAAISARMASPAAVSSTGKPLPGRSGAKGIERAVRDAPDLRDMGENLHALRRQQLQAQAARHAQGAVSRPEKCPPPEAACTVIFYGGG